MAVSKEEEAIKKGLVRRRASRRLKGDDPEVCIPDFSGQSIMI